MSTNPTDGPIPILRAPSVDAREPGELLVVRNGTRIALPLKAVDVAARVAHGVAGVTVRQTYRNPYSEVLEAVYIFPLAGGAVVKDFEMAVGDRRIRGEVKERGEARRDYADALEEGRRAALLEQDRDDVFTLQLGNLPLGEEATIAISYSEMLDAMEDGSVELRLPFVVAPRYIPGEPLDGSSVGQGVESDTDVVRDASRITPPRLAPGVDPDLALTLSVEIDAGSGSVDDLACTQHATRTGVAGGGVIVSLARTDEQLDRDFVLRWRERRADRVGAWCITTHDARGEVYGLVSLVAPRDARHESVARDVVFVLDRSGSMGDVKMASAARACAILLDGLGPADRFAILAFDDRVEWFAPGGPVGEHFARADASGRTRGSAFLRAIDSRGGTEMHRAIGEALEAIGERAVADRDAVVVLLTDGQIGDESRVLADIQKRFKKTRLFTVGVDTAVNDGFLKRLAKLGRGTATMVEPGADLDRALVAIGREIGRPAVTDLTIESESEGAIIAAPERLPDLFEGRRASVFVRMANATPLRIRGRRADGGAFDVRVEPSPIEFEPIAHLWARARITDLEDAYRMDASRVAALKTEIIDVSVHHGVLSRFTAFVVVDRDEIVNQTGSHRTVVQPVAQPAGWGAMGHIAFSAEILRSARPIAPAAPRRPVEMLRALFQLDARVEPEVRGPANDSMESACFSLDGSGGDDLDSLDVLITSLRDDVEAIEASIGRKLTPDPLALRTHLSEFRAVVPVGDEALARVADALDALLVTLEAGEDLTDALAEVHKAFDALDAFWGLSI